MINVSIKLDIFPAKHKIAKIKLLFKKGIKNEAKNYRPISLLKSIQDQTQDHLQRNGLLYIYQQGFRASYFTDTCFCWLTDIILNGAENGKHTSIILIDLQKAFDILDYILLDKIRCIGFSDKTIKWFHSYITNRACFVSLENEFSEAWIINCRVPQGSVLEPLLFLLYTNDIQQALSDSHTHLYEDGTSIFYQDKDVAEIENFLNEDFANLCELLVDNKLSIHFGGDKTKCILFSNEKTLLGLNITYNNN